MAYDEPEIDLCTPRPRTALDRRVEQLFRDVVRPDGNEEMDYGVYGSDDARGYVEPVLHEIAHVVVLRHGVRAALRRPLTTTVGEAVPHFPEPPEPEDPLRTAVANQHEIDTIAVEIIAAKRVRMTFEPVSIAEFAVDGSNVRDLGKATDVAKLICTAMRRPEIRRWGKGLGDFLRAGA